MSGSGSVSRKHARQSLGLTVQVTTDLFRPEKKPGELDTALEQAEALAKEADSLQCNITRDLEKLKVGLLFSALSCWLQLRQAMQHAKQAMQWHLMTLQKGMGLCILYLPQEAVETIAPVLLQTGHCHRCKYLHRCSAIGAGCSANPACITFW